MAEPVIQIIWEYDLANKINYFVFDNATNSNICLEEVFDQLRSELQVSYQCLCCLSHIINLAAEAFISDVESKYVRTNDIKELEVWRKYGPIGKLHNIVTSIYHTPQR